MNSFKAFLSFILFLLAFQVSGQTVYKKFFFNQTGGPEFINAQSEPSFSAFTGGFHKPIFNNLDVNLDGIQDLLVFDHEDYHSMVFIGNGDSTNPNFSYAPEHEFKIPKLYAWVRVADFNGDDKPDIFTSNNIGGVMVYKNVSSSNELKFELYNDDLKHYDSDIGFFTALFVSPADIPVIDDIDNDGDLDVLSFDSGGGNITFYKNHSVETYDHRDSFNFFVSTYCWGRFQEADTSNDIVFAPRCYLFKKAKHAGSNMLAVDIDADGDKDLLLSDVAYKDVILLENGWDPNSTDGHSRDTMIKAYKNFPSYDTPIELDLFPSMHYVDVDFDGVNDLICAPSSQEENFVVNNTWYYKNTGRNDKPVFEFVEKDFIQKNTIETGEYSRSALADLDGDGDYDLIVASPKPYTNFEYDNAFTRLFYYENVGDSTKAKFTLKDDDFLSLGDYEFFNAIPAFGDADNNGTVDLLLGLSNGKIAMFANANKPRKEAAFSIIADSFLDVKVSANAAPCLFDVNGDNDIDLLIGDLIGKVAYYEWNSNTSAFEEVTNSFMDVNVGLPTVGFSVPRIGDVNGDGRLDLVVADNFGSLNFYESLDIEDNSYAAQDNFIVYNPFEGFGNEKDFGSLISIDLVDLNADTLLDIVMGNKRGGLYFLEGIEVIYDGIMEAPENGLLEVYPNPANSNITISWMSTDESTARLSIIDLSGKTVHKQTIKNGASIDISKLLTGVFVMQVQLDNGSRFVKKLQKQ